MKYFSRTFIIVVIPCALFVFAIAWRLFFPYFQQQDDEPTATESRSEVSAIMDAINQYVRENEPHNFPSTLNDITPLVHLPGTNMQAVFNRFVYLKPSEHSSGANHYDNVVLIEKLGHYKHKSGGYHGVAGEAFAEWFPESDYEALAKSKGLSISQLSQ